MAGRVERSARPRRRAARADRPPLTTKDVLQPARLAVRPALAFGSGLRQMLQYWRAERRTLRQGLVALTVAALGNIPTGLALGAMSGRLETLPGLLLLIPGAIGMRGSIFGALGSRLGTGLHAGTLRFTRQPDSVLGQNVAAVALQSGSLSLLLAVVAAGASQLVGLETIGMRDLIVISVLGGILASAVVLVATIAVARASQRREWDLDAVATPVITFIGDLVTIPALYLASLLAGRGRTTDVLALVCTLLGVAATIGSVRAQRPIVRRVLRESAATFVLAAIIDIIAGITVQHRSHRFTTLPAVLILLPSFLSNAGALGGIVSARLSSKLHLGAIRPKLIPERLAALDASLAAPLALTNFALIGLLAHVLAITIDKPSPGALPLVAASLVAGSFATVAALISSYAIAVAAYRFDLDPDNHTVALVTSVMDLVGVLCILAGISITGVIP